MSAEPALSGRLRAVPGRGVTVPRYGVRPRPLGDPAPLACTLAKAAIEAILGGDGINSLVRWVADDVLDRLARQHSLARRAGWCGGVATIDRARVCRISARIAEVSIVATANGRSRGVAMRFEDVRGRWLATVLEIV